MGLVVGRVAWLGCRG
jgi:hypothetical protein